MLLDRIPHVAQHSVTPGTGGVNMLIQSTPGLTARVVPI